MSRFDDDLIIKLKKEGKTWQEVGDVFGAKGEAVRKYSAKKDWFKDIREDKYVNSALISEENPKLENYDLKTFNSDGSVSSSIRERLSKKKTFTKKELLEIHGLDPEEFKIRRIVSNEWSVTNSEGEIYYNFQSKIIAEPLSGEDELIKQLEELITKYTKPLEIKRNNYALGTNDKAIVIPFPDMHFGLNTSKDYLSYQEQIFDNVSKPHKTIVFNILGDWLHTDNFVHETVSGTRVNDTNIPLAWEESSKFIEPLIQRALLTTDDVRLIYSRGNHDESMTWAYCKYLEVKYPQLKANIETDQLKVTTIDEMAVYFTHGHKQKNKLSNLCASLYPVEWGKTKRRILLTGHYHHIDSKDHSGIVQYGLPTPSKYTDYELDNLYMGAEKGMHLFEIMNSKISAIYYL